MSASGEIRWPLTEGLIGNGHAAAVTRFEMVDTSDGRWIVLEWEEPRAYSNVEPRTTAPRAAR